MNPTLRAIVQNNSYVKGYRRIKPFKDKQSLEYLIARNLHENEISHFRKSSYSVIKDIIHHYNPVLTEAKLLNHNLDDNYQMFANRRTGCIHYGNLQPNLNIDTSHKREVCKEFFEIQRDLQEYFPDFQIKSHLVAMRYINGVDISNYYISKYMPRVISLNEYFRELDVDVQFDREVDYQILLNYISDKMFTNDN